MPFACLVWFVVSIGKHILSRSIMTIITRLYTTQRYEILRISFLFFLTQPFFQLIQIRRCIARLFLLATLQISLYLERERNLFMF